MTQSDPRSWERDRPDLSVRRTIAAHNTVLPTRLTGEENLTVSGERLAGGHVVDFWRWSMSSLLDNTTRGRFAEYLVAHALEGTKDGVRVEWDPVDVITDSGLRVEVKSVSFLQSWAQPETSTAPKVSIPATFAWDPHTGRYETEQRRQADVYVTCVLDVTHIDDVDPLNLDQWRFLVIPTHVLDSQIPGQKSIVLHRLASLPGVTECTYTELRDAVEHAGSDP